MTEKVYTPTMLIVWYSEHQMLQIEVPLDMVCTFADLKEIALKFIGKYEYQVHHFYLMEGHISVECPPSNMLQIFFEGAFEVNEEEEIAFALGGRAFELVFRSSI